MERLKTAVREFAVIVAGVLCALGAQAWWESRQEAAHERQYLSQLRADVQENDRRLRTALATDSAAAHAMRNVAAMLKPDTPVPPVDSVIAWVSGTGSSSEFRPVTGTFRALIGTGDLRLIRDDSLRFMLTSYAVEMDAEAQRQLQLREVVMQQAQSLGRLMPFMLTAFSTGPDRSRVNVPAMRANPEVAELLFMLQAANSNRIAGLRRAKEETQALLAALGNR